MVKDAVLAVKWQILPSWRMESSPNLLRVDFEQIAYGLKREKALTSMYRRQKALGHLVECITFLSTGTRNVCEICTDCIL
jgi:hypothetical protein